MGGGPLRVLPNYWTFGRLPIVTSTSTGAFARTTTSFTVDPGFSSAMRASSVGVSRVGLPAISTTTSRGAIPALSAGPPRWTLRISTPSTRSSASARATSAVRSCGSTPSQPRVTSPLWMICSPR